MFNAVALSKTTDICTNEEKYVSLQAYISDAKIAR